MEFLLISENKIKISLAKADLDKYKITIIPKRAKFFGRFLMKQKEKRDLTQQKTGYSYRYIPERTVDVNFMFQR